MNTLEPHTIDVGDGKPITIDDDRSARIDRLVAARQLKTNEDAATARVAVQELIVDVGLDEVERREQA